MHQKLQPGSLLWILSQRCEFLEYPFRFLNPENLIEQCFLPNSLLAWFDQNNRKWITSRPYPAKAIQFSRASVSVSVTAEMTIEKKIPNFRK